LQFMVGLKKLLTVRMTPGGWKICNTWIFTHKSEHWYEGIYIQMVDRYRERKIKAFWKQELTLVLLTVTRQQSTTKYPN
jgi:hypothetical protein